MPRAIGVNDITNIWTYLKSIEWLEERWLHGLIAFHLLCTTTLIVGRNHSIVQITVFLLLLILVFLSENINEWAAKNYKSFSNQQYFDSNGLFISVVFSLPALINCFFIVMFWFVDTGKMMVKVQKAKVRHRQREDSNSVTSSSPTTATSEGHSTTSEGHKTDASWKPKEKKNSKKHK